MSSVTAVLCGVLYVLVASAAASPWKDEGQAVLRSINLGRKSENLTFDDISTIATGADPLPLVTTYHDFTFTSFNLFNTTGLTFANNSDCALSPPNAVIGHRPHAKAWPRFLYSPDPEEAQSNGHSPFVNLRGWAIKPCGEDLEPYTMVMMTALGVIDHRETSSRGGYLSESATEELLTLDLRDPITNVDDTMWINGYYEIISKHTLWSYWWQGGHAPQFFSRIEENFPGWGEKVNLVQIYGEAPRKDGQDEGEDWPFCVDNLEVEYRSVKDEEREDRENGSQRFMDVEMMVG